jgi:hypothetical protein
MIRKYMLIGIRFEIYMKTPGPDYHYYNAWLELVNPPLRHSENVKLYNKNSELQLK